MRPDLASISKQQRGVFRRRQALQHYTRREVDHQLAIGAWVIVRHGIYTTHQRWLAATKDDRSKLLLDAAAALLTYAGDVVLSHQSAAAYHNLSLLDPLPPLPSLTRHRAGAAERMTAHAIAVAAVPTSHRVPAVPVTTAARTVADCARTLPLESAFVTAESALRLGLSRIDVLDVLAACGGWPGAAQARDVITRARQWSESPLESLHRLWFREQGLPQPEQQRLVVRVGGGVVARVDFVWPQYRTVCEADGRLKYDEADALWREKLREDVLRDLGLEVVRGYWRDRDDNGAALAERLRRAFRRGVRTADESAYRIISPEVPRVQPLAVRR